MTQDKISSQLRKRPLTSDVKSVVQVLQINWTSVYFQRRSKLLIRKKTNTACCETHLKQRFLCMFGMRSLKFSH